EFMVDGEDKGFTESCPALSLRFYGSKKALGQAVIAKAKANRRQSFCFQGQFNTSLWLALLSGGIKPAQFYWHIWGADLYEVSHGLKFRLFYPCRRFAKGRVGGVFATLGDLSYFSPQHPDVLGELRYLPIDMD
ncbi:TDP-N-acetylfucosamine:lipid II N-acetylfucosaminyltransferase, partial [Salmonella enterica]|uniref:TDP-N-acetylfucosamine:lipid II N-acetylfucosaminyltransferase n=1 Tax=Salmonella enterica TaxID=28901 RepID=UPI00398C38FB